MTLIHCALQCEAQTFIEKLKLKKTSSNPKIFSNNKYILIISGIGKVNTLQSLEYIFNNFTIKKAFNIGVAGCASKTIPIGSLFCTNHKLNNIKHMKLLTSLTPVNSSCSDNKDVLYDMEAKYFLEVCNKYVESDYIYVFKVVSDHLDVKGLKKDFVKSLILKSLDNYIALF